MYPCTCVVVVMWMPLEFGFYSMYQAQQPASMIGMFALCPWIVNRRNGCWVRMFVCGRHACHVPSVRAVISLSDNSTVSLFYSLD